MRTHGSKATRHRQAPPGRRALDAEAQASHFEVEATLLRDRVRELEALVARITDERDAAMRAAARANGGER